jgi:hypothetical protein
VFDLVSEDTTHQKVEVRPGRSLFCRTVRIPYPIDDTEHRTHHDGTVPSANPCAIIHLLLVHGSCGARWRTFYIQISTTVHTTSNAKKFDSPFRTECDSPQTPRDTPRGCDTSLKLQQHDHVQSILLSTKICIRGRSHSCCEPYWFHRSVECPRFLVIHGNEDGIFPVVKAQKLVHAIECGVQRRMTTRPNSNEDVVQFHVVDDASHQVFQERPDFVARLIWDFISPILPNSS